MPSPRFRIVGRPVSDRAQLIEHNDTLEYPRTLPDGRKVWAGTVAANYPGVAGVPAGVMMDAGFRIYAQWLCEIQDHHLVRAVARVLGPACAIAERPCSAVEASAPSDRPHA